MLLSNKALLVVLWEMNYGHPNLLPDLLRAAALRLATTSRSRCCRAKAPTSPSARRGTVRAQPGGYGAEGFVYQGVAPLPEFGGRYPVIGSWIVGEAPAGIGIREDDSPITRNSSRFVPHYFT